MKMGELKKVIQFFPDDMDVTIETAKAPPEWIPCGYGNHDGRFTIKCPSCGWESHKEFLPGEQHLFPNRCPGCGIEIGG